MPRKPATPARTPAGHTRDVVVERVGKVTIYRRGDTYCLYYRQGGLTHRRKVDGNLAVARATAHKVLTALDDNRPSPVAYTRISPDELVAGYLAAVADVQKLSLRTQDRYRAALQRFTDYCQSARIVSADRVDVATVEGFVAWLRGAKRARNGAANGRRKDAYQLGGVKFILATCQTAFNWAARRRMLPPYAENPFAAVGVDRLKDRPADAAPRVFSPDQERAFFAACDDWQRPLFAVLAAYGLRVGELTHLLVEDVDLAADQFVVRSKPWLFWQVKTGKERRLPLVPATRPLFERALGGRRSGFVFVNRPPKRGRSGVEELAGGTSLRSVVERELAAFDSANPGGGERKRKRVAVAVARRYGQIPEKRVREEFMALTRQIGCPEFTRAHDLRHLFTTRAQAAGVNPLLVQDVLGHATLDMTRRYTHLGLDDARAALAKLAPGPHPAEGGQRDG
jgi:integrase